MIVLYKMAESLREKSSRSNKAGVKNESFVNVECAVCLQTSIHPAELPCGHIFCFLCIKGIVNQGRRCAMCRQDIPVDYLDKPRLLKPVDLETNNRGFEDGRLWFYEGHNGWWQYDERTSLELESAYQKGDRCCELLIAGFLYIADFDAMLQYRRNDPCRRRRIKRDLATISSKGVAGLKAAKDNNSTISNTPDLVSNVLIPDLQSLHISGRPLHSHLNNSNLPILPNLTSCNFNRQQLGSVQNNFVPSDRSLSTVSPSNTCSTTPLYNSDIESSIESNNTLPTRNFELDSAIHDTLDLTIEQIEALHLELSNDFENLFNRISNYQTLPSNIDIDRSAISTHNSLSPVIISNGELGSALGSGSYSTTRVHTATRLNCSEGSAHASSQLAPNELASLPHRTTERLFVRPSLLSNSGESPSASRSRVSSRNGCKKITSEQL